MKAVILDHYGKKWLRFGEMPGLELWSLRIADDAAIAVIGGVNEGYRNLWTT
jgi:hypothetical protein